MAHILDSPTEPDTAARALLASLGTAMVATGQPVNEVEEELTLVSAHLGYPDLQIAATPTGVTLTLSRGGMASYQSTSGPLRLDQATDVRRILYELLADEMTPAEAQVQLGGLRAKPPRFPRWLVTTGAVAVATGIALTVQPGLTNVALAAVAALLLTAVDALARRSELLTTLLPTVAAFLVACLVFAAANAGVLDGPLRTLLPPLTILLPGALLVTGMSELAAGDMVAGSSRLTFGVVQLLLLSLGVVAAAAVLGVGPASLVNVRVDELGWWAVPLGLGLVSLGVCLLESVPFRLLPYVTLVVVCAFAAQWLGQLVGAAALGSFCGAVAASFGASVIELVRPRLPRMVVFLPAFWLLVPGSLGLLSVTELAINPGRVSTTAFDVLTAISAIALGLLIGSALARSLRSLVRRVGRARALLRTD